MSIEVRTYTARDLPQHLPRWQEYVLRGESVPLSRDPAWLAVLARGLRHEPYCLEVAIAGQTRGLLPLAFVSSWLFGRFLVSLPYLNYGGVRADEPDVARALIDSAVALADRLKVRFLELRHEQAIDHPALVTRPNAKVHMRLALPPTAGELWDRLDTKVRNQVRKGQKNELTATWGGLDLLPEFYDVFSHNMRDLGTPVYGRELFRAALAQFAQQAELCVVSSGPRALAAGLLLHGKAISEVPSAAALRSERQSNANMLLYWHLLERCVQRGQKTFDFGRSSPDSSTFDFKKQWGAEPAPAVWQYYLRQGTIDEMRPDNPRYQRLIRIWQRLPVSLTRLIGPPIVRGIP